MELEKQKNTNQNGKKILESIIRALIKLIPYAGESLDQAFFGSRDAIENAELREMIQDIYEIIIEINERDLSKYGQEPETILPKVMLQPKIQTFLSRLNNISQKSNDELLDLMLQLQISISENAEVVEAFSKSLQELQDLQAQAIVELQKSRTAQKNIEKLLEERFERLESKIERLAMSDAPPVRRDLQTIYEELRNIEVEYLIDVGSDLVMASNLIQSGYILEWAVDTTEPLAYARLPFLRPERKFSPPDKYAGFRIFLFNQLDHPFYVLPPTAAEISRKVESIRLASIDGLHAVDGIFFERLGQLFQEQRLVLWRNSFRYNPDISLSPIYDELRKMRPSISSEINNLFDAEVLNFLNEYNMKPINNNVRLGFITGSHSVLSLVNRMTNKKDYRNDDDTYQGLYISGQPLVINPYVYAAIRYSTINKNNKILAGLTKHASFISEIKTRLDNMRLWLDNPTPLHLEQVLFEIQNIRKSLISIDELVRPFHDKVANIQLEDYKSLPIKNYKRLPKDDSTQNYTRTYGNTVSNVLSVMADLASYIKPAIEALKPFRDIQQGDE